MSLCMRSDRKFICLAYQKFSSSNADASGQKIRDTLLDLAMDWNCIDVAKEFAFENSLAEISV